jgi:hypothetical protein
VAVLLHKGLSPGAALAFLITGPATSITTFAVLAKLHGRKVTLAFGGVVAITSICLGLALNALLPAQTGLAHEPHAEHGGVLEWVGLVLLTALFVASLLRQGPRGFLAQLLPAADHHGEGSVPTGERLSELHVHGPACGHDPGPSGHTHPGARPSLILMNRVAGNAPVLVLPRAHVHGPECQDGAACTHGH